MTPDRRKSRDRETKTEENEVIVGKFLQEAERGGHQGFQKKGPPLTGGGY